MFSIRWNAACVDLTVLGDDSELFYSGIDFHPDDRVIYIWIIQITNGL